MTLDVPVGRVRSAVGGPRGRRGRALAVGLVLWLAVASASAVVRAEGDGEPIHLEYSSTEGCPDEAAFVARIRSRTEKARFVGPEERVRTFVVKLQRGSPPSGSVTVTEAELRQGARRLQADSCEHVADALTLIVALALDPHLIATPETPPLRPRWERKSTRAYRPRP